MNTPNRAPWTLTPAMLRSRAVCCYVQAVVDALPNARGERDPAAVAWLEVARAHMQSFDNPQ